MNRSEVLFSVVIPTYNRADFLLKTIQSVLNQEFRLFEVIIVDDGSTDQTKQVVESFKGPRIIYLKKQNGERGAARNYGIRRAKGDYVTFLDSDDLLNYDHLTSAKNYIQKYNPVILHLGYNVADSNGKIIIPWKKLPSPVNDKLIEGNFLSCLGMFIKREVLLENPFNEDRDLAGSEDYELWLRLAARYPIYAYDKVTASLVNHNDRSMVRTEKSKLIKRIDLLQNYLMNDQVFVNKYQHSILKLKAFLDIYIALHLVLLPNCKEYSLQFVLHAIKKYPAMIFNKRLWVVLKKVIFN